MLRVAQLERMLARAAARGLGEAAKLAIQAELEAARQAGEADAAAARGGTAGRSCSADKPKSERARYIALGVLFGSWCVV